MTSDKLNPSQRARGIAARERAHGDHEPGGAGARRWARQDAARIRMDISDDFFKRHAHYIASTATFRPSARGSAHEASVTSRVARVGADAAYDARSGRDRGSDRGVSDGVPTDELDPQHGSGRS